MKKRIFIIGLVFILVGIFTTSVVLAETHGGEASAGHASPYSAAFLGIVALLFFARVGAMIEKIGQPSVLGELVVGIILAGVALLPGFGILNDLRDSELVKFVAEVGVIILLFRTGLESNLGEMKKVGFRAFLVAIVGVILPFVGGFFLAKWLMPGLETNTYLFLGATLTATSVGITARVFKDLNFIKRREAQIVLGAAVIDDVLGLLILAIVAGIVTAGSISAGAIVWLTVKAVLFLGGAIIVGQLVAPLLGRFLSKVHPGVGMKTALALAFCAIFAESAVQFAGLAAIVGAFAAGLVLDPVHFKSFTPPSIVERLRYWAGKIGNDECCREMEETAKHEEHAHVENLIDGLGTFFVPVFFVYTGLQVNLTAFTDLKTLGIALAITLVAVLGKYLCGFVSGKGVNKALVGFGMVPRGEVGLIFANVGKQLGVVNDQMFAVAVIMVILTTLITPLVLSVLIKKENQASGEINLNSELQNV